MPCPPQRHRMRFNLAAAAYKMCASGALDSASSNAIKHRKPSSQCIRSVVRTSAAAVAAAAAVKAVQAADLSTMLSSLASPTSVAGRKLPGSLVVVAAVVVWSTASAMAQEVRRDANVSVRRGRALTHTAADGKNTCFAIGSVQYPPPELLAKWAPHHDSCVPKTGVDEGELEWSAAVVVGCLWWSDAHL